MPKPQLSIVDRGNTAASALEFSETVRCVVDMSRRGGLVAPVFRSPPRLDGVDRTILRRGRRRAVVAIRRAGRPLPAVQSDVIEAVVVANQLGGERADRFRRAAWNRLAGAAPTRPGPTDEPGPGRGRPTGGSAGSVRVA